MIIGQIVERFLALGLCLLLGGFASAHAAESFLMPVEDAFSIAGRGVVVTGRIERGEVKSGQSLQLLGILPARTVKVEGIETHRKLVQSAKKGDSIGLILNGLDLDVVKRGQVLATPKTLKPSKTFTAAIHLLPTAEGGRKTPVQSGYRPQVYLRTSDFSATIALPKSVTSIAPGSDATVNVTLMDVAALEPGQKFAIRESGKTVGTGTVKTVTPN